MVNRKLEKKENFVKNDIHSFLKAKKEKKPCQYIVIPSMSFDRELLEGIEGVSHYELRSLWEILRVKDKNVYVTFVSSYKIPFSTLKHFKEIYNLSAEEFSRVSFVEISRKKNILSLTKNILIDESALKKIKKTFKCENVLLEPFVFTHQEKALSRLLEIPSWYDHPQMNYFHTKSGNRFIVGSSAPMPDGLGDLFSFDAVVKGVIKLKNDKPGLESCMVKLNFGVSGQGNMKLDLPSGKAWEALLPKEKEDSIRNCFESAKLFNKTLKASDFKQRIIEEGAVVEEFISNEIISSPSAQIFCKPDSIDLISTHHQILDKSGQKFLGGSYPCDDQFRKKIEKFSIKVGEKLKDLKVFGVVSIDFLISKNQKTSELDYHLIELNIRKGGTTHPFMLSNFAIKSNEHFEAGPPSREFTDNYVYRSNDNFYPCRTRYSCQKDILEKATADGILFSRKKKEGVIFHLLSSYEETGKVGYTILASSKDRIDQLEALINGEV
ncbi:MAG: hypothetical protein CME61_02090 [Halobacteriovoraceae bacterium]|nr:hypothetical protein [Halobacteriovoraceae bacterium]